MFLKFQDSISYNMKYLIKIINSVRLSFIAFLILNVVIYFVQKWLDVDLSIYNSFDSSISDFFAQLDETAINSYINQSLHKVVNIISLGIVAAIIIYALICCYKYFLNWAKSNTRKAHIINYVFVSVYLVYTIGVLINVSEFMKFIQRFFGVLLHIISNLLCLDNIRNVPCESFAINLLFRFILVCVFICLATFIKPLWKHFFVDRVKVENGVVIPANKTDKKSTTRIVRFFYNEEKNKLNLRNIIALFAVLGAVFPYGAFLFDAITDGDLIDKCWSVVSSLLQLSTVNDSPFAEPAPISKAINIIFRLSSVGLYIAISILIVYLIYIFFQAVEKKDVAHHLQTASITAVIVASATMFIFVVSKTAEELQDSGRVIFIAILCAAAIALSVLIITFFIGKGNKNSSGQKSQGSPRNKFFSFVKYSWSKTLCVIKSLTKPIYENLTEDHKKHSVLYGAANFCALASLITTFLGLLSFFTGTLLTGNIFLFIICVIICLFVTAGVQYAMLNIGILIGKYAGSVFARSSLVYNKDFLDKNNNVKRFNAARKVGMRLFERSRRAAIAAAMFCIYIFPMFISSLFSFASFFSGASLIGGYRDIVNNDVWNNSVADAKTIMEDVVSEYNMHNSEIKSAIDNQYMNYIAYSSKISAWDQSYNDFSVDGHALQFLKQTGGLSNYRNAINMLLDEDRYNSYDLKSAEQRVYFGNGEIYRVHNHEITRPYNMSLNPLESPSPIQTPDANEPSPTPRSTYGEHIEKTNNNLEKYQLIDILFGEYVAQLQNAKSLYDDAGKIVPKNAGAAPTIEPIQSPSPYVIETSQLTNSYNDNIDDCKRIFSVFNVIRNEILSTPDTPVKSDELVSINQMPAEVIKYSMYNAKGKRLNSSDSVSSLESGVTPDPAATPEPSPVDDSEYDTVKLKETKFDVRMSRLIDMLSYLPGKNKNVSQSDDNEQVTSNTEENTASDSENGGQSNAVSPDTSKAEASDDNKELSDVISNISKYYNYANSREISLAFGLDVAYKGEKCDLPHIYLAEKLLKYRNILHAKSEKPSIGDIDDNDTIDYMNPYRDRIKDIYSQSSLVFILMIIAFMIDLMPIIIGLLIKATNAYRSIKSKASKKGNKKAGINKDSGSDDKEEQFENTMTSEEVNV